MSNATMI